MAKDPAAPRKQRSNPFKQIASVYKAVKSMDPSITWWLLGVFIGVLALFVIIGFLVDHPIYFVFIGLPIAALAAMITLSRRGEKAAFGAMQGKAGQSVGALSMLRRGWYYDQEPVAADVARPQEIANAAMIFRALGAPGVVLIGEGPLPRAKKLMEKEVKKVARVAPGVPIHQLYVGDDDGQVSARKLTRTMTKLKGTLTKEEMSAVNKRLKSIPGIRQGIPAGVDPTKARMDRRQLRGR
ncbi:DUF4191 domain-containing protein [Nostocoides australiense]